MGTRMGNLTEHRPKCMTELPSGETILSGQLRQLSAAGVSKVIMATGFKQDLIVRYCNASHPNTNFVFVFNPIYDQTNYIYSVYLAREYLHDDILILHGDMVLDDALISDMLKEKRNCMSVSFVRPLPEKDFKAVIKNGRIHKVGVEFFEDAVYAQPVYKLDKNEWEIWLQNIEKFCLEGNTGCYAEVAFNEISERMRLYPFDVKDRLCMEVDTAKDLETAGRYLTGGQP
jgi:phosphoenolpyruvate phosphomutase